MKKIKLILLLILPCFAGFSQITQYIGAPGTKVEARGYLKSDLGYINAQFKDTAAANSDPYIKNYPGAQIYTFGVDSGTVWVRDNLAKSWIKQATSSGVGAYTASNGVTKVGNDFQLGGALTKSDTIQTGANSLLIRTVGGSVTSKAVDANDSVKLYLNSGATTDSYGFLTGTRFGRNATLLVDARSNSPFISMSSSDLSTYDNHIQINNDSIQLYSGPALGGGAATKFGQDRSHIQFNVSGLVGLTMNSAVASTFSPYGYLETGNVKTNFYSTHLNMTDAESGGQSDIWLERDSIVFYNSHYKYKFRGFENSDTNKVLSTDANGLFVLRTKVNSSTNIYNSDGTLTGNRIVNQNSNTLSFTNSTGFSIAGSDAVINGLTVGRGLGQDISNTVFGNTALSTNFAGTNNVAIGYQALKSNYDGAQNVAIGYNALIANTSGGSNIGIGSYSLSAINNVAGTGNIGIGIQSGQNVTTGTNNVFLGSNTGIGITTGNYNTIIGTNVNGLSSTLSKNIILSDGQGVVRQQFNSTGAMALSGSYGTSGQYLQTQGTGTPPTWVTPATGLTGSGTTNYLSKWTGSTALGNSLVYDNGSSVGIGTSSPAAQLHTTGSVRFAGLSNSAGRYLIHMDAGGNLSYADTTAGGGGTPAGSNTQIQYNNSGSFGASQKLTYSAGTLTLGDSITAIIDSSYFYGNSITAGTAASPINKRWTTLVSQNLGTVEINRGISSTTLQRVTTGDSSMFDRLYTLPAKRLTERYLFLSYGINDANHALDTFIFKTQYYTIIDTAVARGWPLNRIVLLTPSLQGAPYNTAGTKFVTAVLGIAALKGTQVVNVYSYMQSNGGSTLLSSDSIHPTTAGHTVIYNAIISGINPNPTGVLTVKGRAVIKQSLSVGLDTTSANYMLAVNGTSLLNGAVTAGAISSSADASINGLTIGLGSGQSPQSTTFGVGALGSINSALYLSAFGFNALNHNTSGNYNEAFGRYSLYANTTGYNNAGFGSSTLQNNTVGHDNMAVGYQALFANVSGSYNTAIGSSALTVNTYSFNTGIGFQALTANVGGADNTGIGYQSLNKVVSGYDNTAIGYQSIFNGTGNNNTAVGSSALYTATTGADNTAVGYQANYKNVTGNFNTSVGEYANYNSTASNNVAVGRSCAQDVTTGGGNTIIGYNTGRGITTGPNNTIIGANVTGLAAGLSNNIILSDGAGNIRVDVDNNGNVGIGTTTPQATLDIQGSMRTVTAAKSANYTLSTSDNTIYATTGVGGITITLPAASANTVGLYYFIYKVDAGVGLLTISPTGADVVNGAASKTIANQYNGVLVRGLTSTSWLVTSFTGL